MNVTSIEQMDQDVAAHCMSLGLNINWVEITDIHSVRKDLYGAHESKRVELSVEVHGSDHHGFPRHRVVKSQGDNVSQAFEKLKAEIHFIKYGRTPA